MVNSPGTSVPFLHYDTSHIVVVFQSTAVVPVTIDLRLVHFATLVDAPDVFRTPPSGKLLNIPIITPRRKSCFDAKCV